MVWKETNTSVFLGNTTCADSIKGIIDGTGRPRCVEIHAGQRFCYDFAEFDAYLVFVVFVFVVVVVFVFAASDSAFNVTFVVGAVVGQVERYQHVRDARVAKVRPVLRELQLADVNFDESSTDEIFLSGTVPTGKAYKTLEERIRFLFGDEEARSMMSDVSVAQGRIKPDQPDR